MVDKSKDSEWYKEFQRANQKPGPPGRRDVKREHDRFELDGADTIVFEHGLLKIIGLKRTLKATVTLDLSTGGVGVIIGRRLAPKTKVNVKIQMDKYQDVIEADGVIRWCYQNKTNNEEFYAGIMFEDLDPVQSKKIGRMKDWFTSPEYKTAQVAKKKPDQVLNDILKPNKKK